MPLSKFESRPGDAAAVEALLSGLQHPFKAEIGAVRAILRAAHPDLHERVKWNAPSFFYKADLAAFNLRQTQFVQLILLFPFGLIPDDSGLLLGHWKDKREARFTSLADVRAKAPALTRLVRQWVILAQAASAP